MNEAPIRLGDHELRIRALEIVSAPETAPPFDVDAVAFEEDTYLILSAAPELREPVEHPLKILTAAHEAEPAEPGSVLVRPGSPLRLLAVVHELERQPTWRPEWVARALEGILHAADARGLRGVGLPPIGTRHGTLEIRHFGALLGRALQRAPLDHLRGLWVVAALDAGAEILDALEVAWEEPAKDARPT